MSEVTNRPADSAKPLLAGAAPDTTRPGRESAVVHVVFRPAGPIQPGAEDRSPTKRRARLAQQPAADARPAAVSTRLTPPAPNRATPPAGVRLTPPAKAPTPPAGVRLTPPAGTKREAPTTRSMKRPAAAAEPRSFARTLAAIVLGVFAAGVWGWRFSAPVEAPPPAPHVALDAPVFDGPFSCDEGGRLWVARSDSRPSERVLVRPADVRGVVVRDQRELLLLRGGVLVRAWPELTRALDRA